MQKAINCGTSDSVPYKERSVQKSAQKRHSSVFKRHVMHIEMLADFRLIVALKLVIISTSGIYLKLLTRSIRESLMKHNFR